MANPGVATKYLSVNLNKSYGQQTHHQQNHGAHSNSYGSGRSKASVYTNSGGGGMVVLSRPRSSQKAGQKLSVPPPLNLPSLRKEHERFDSTGLAGIHPGSGISSNRLRPSSSGVGWSKPSATMPIQEKDAFGSEHAGETVDQGIMKSDGVSRGNGSLNAPPTGRLGATGSFGVEGSAIPVDRAMFLRREEFPSLQATITTTNGPMQRPKECINQKQLQNVDDNIYKGQKIDSRQSAFVEMRPQLQSVCNNSGSGFSQDSGINRDISRSHELNRKDYFPGPLPLVCLGPRSDWADDERDTGHGVADRMKDHGFAKSEAFWDRDSDISRSVFVPQKLGTNYPTGRRVPTDGDAGHTSSNEFSKVDSNSRGIRALVSGDSWRGVCSLPKDGSGAREMARDRTGSGIKPERPPSASREANNDTKRISSSLRENCHGSMGKRDMAYDHGLRQPWKNAIATLGYRGMDVNPKDRFGNGHGKYTVDASQNDTLSRGSLSSGSKGLPINDPILSLSREKRLPYKGEKSYLEDPFLKGLVDGGFDGRDPFSGTLFGVVKKKKETLKPTVFHDPVRESFEAELERVQKMQEEERRRIVEEQERALEVARREEEERLQLIQEQEEHQRRTEEEAREAVRRAEQERMEALRRAEEMRLAKEEERQRILVEEERRKQAAKQKLIELEEKIAKRRAEAVIAGSSSSKLTKEKDCGVACEREDTKLENVVGWEDGERMVQQISSRSDPTTGGRPFELDSGLNFGGDGTLPYPDKGKPLNSWRRDGLENGKGTAVLHDAEKTQNNSWRDRSRGFLKKENYGNTAFMTSRSYCREAAECPYVDEFAISKDHRWNAPGNGSHSRKKSVVESEYTDASGDHYGDDGWGKGQDYRSNQRSYSVYGENHYENYDPEGYYASSRTRYSIKQPRVPPPPSLSSIQKAHRGANHGIEHHDKQTGPSSFLGNDHQKSHHVDREERTSQTEYNGSHHSNLVHPGVLDMQHNPENKQKLGSYPSSRCDSQSSHSVSSPPASPIHLSHDDLDDSMDSSVLPQCGEEKNVAFLDQDKEHVALAAHLQGDKGIVTPGAVLPSDDEDWTVDDREQLQEQEEYDEDEDGYQEEDEVHGGDDELAQEVVGMHIQGESAHMMNNVVLGFNEGVEVGIPNDDLERSSGNDAAFMKLHSIDDVSSDEQSVHPMEGKLPANIPSSSTVYQEKSKKEMLMDHMENTCSPCMRSQQMVSPSVPLVSAQEANVAPSRSEFPVKLQFGLFSGPTLIPSPVPAIQIGSIQMPLPLHHHVGQSLPHMQPSQSQIFQFGQLRYQNPVSQGLLSLTPQSISFVQPSVVSSFTANQNSVSPTSIQPGEESSGNNQVKYCNLDNQTGVVSGSVGLPQSNKVQTGTYFPGNENAESILVQQKPAINYNVGQEKTFSLRESLGNQNVPVTSMISSSVGESEGLLETSAVASELVKGKSINRSKAVGQYHGGRGKRYMYAVKQPGSRSTVSEVSHSETGAYQKKSRRQRAEFRIRENCEIMQPSNVGSPNHLAFNNAMHINGNGMTNGIKTGVQKTLEPNKKSKQNEFGRPSYISTQKGMDWRNVSAKAAGKELPVKVRNSLNYAGGNFVNMHPSTENIDMPLQSGVVRIFEQPGIEPPSDDDDFIEVRSKKQMLNDRREQRERQIKAKTRAVKAVQKSFPAVPSVSASGTKISTAGGALAMKKQSSTSTPLESIEKPNLSSTVASVGLSAPIVSMSLAPIGTPAVKCDAQNDGELMPMRSFKTESLPSTSGGQNVPSSYAYVGKNSSLDKVQAPAGTWGNAQNNKVVMSLTQTQLDEAMKPLSFEVHSPMKDQAGAVSEASASSSAFVPKEKAFSSASSPVNSLLAGEKIQFGAVTSPTVLPPRNCVSINGVAPLVPPPVEHQIGCKIPASENGSLLFAKGKHQNGACSHLQECEAEAEAEAEAAASAVAVAAIASDEISGNPLGACPVSVADTKSFRCRDLDGGDDVSNSKAEETLSVSLPADLSVETPPISLWPPIASPHNSSNHMISHFPGGPQHIPFYEMNPLLGAPIFAFGPQDESASNQSQSQKSNAAVTAPHGNWPQYHSGVDSFYGPPAGFTGPYVSPPGGIPSVQGPPHMVVYNHFAPVGQFGQVGLSFMGTTFIPSGKQPDWKHNPVSSALNGEVDAKNLKTQQNPASTPASVQHMGPRSSLLPMPSPLPVFDAPPFKSSPEVPMQGRWSHVPASPLQSVPPMPLQHQLSGVSHFSHVHVEQSLAGNRFSQVHTTSTSVPSQTYPVVTDATVTRLPDELGLAGASSSSAQSVASHSHSSSTGADVSQSSMGQSNSTGNNGVRNSNSALKPKNMAIQQYGNSSGYDHHRGMGSQKQNAGCGDWSHRRSGFYGRNQFNGEKNFQPVKLKQIYVAKPASSGSQQT